MDNVYNLLENLKLNNKTVVAAISGGPDSMLLLNILINLREKLNINIVVAHVHHNLRKESDFEASKLKDICIENNLIFEFKKIEKYPNDKFTEESARIIRYNFFDEVVSKYKTDILFTAHHSDDLMETILMRITRGSTIKGYAGFETISTDRGYKIIKPLIFLTKDEILNELSLNNSWYAIDMSNKSLKYTRNRYRNKVLPILKEENNSVSSKFLEFNNKLLMADNYIKKESLKEYKKLCIENTLDILNFKKLDSILKIYVLEKYLDDVYKDNIILLNYKHINIILSAIEKKNNCTLDLPNNKIGIIEYGKFIIIDKKENIDYDYTFDNYIKLPNNKIIKIDNNTSLTTNYVIHLNSADIKFPLHVRNRRAHDRMTVKNMTGSIKINDIFTNSKIPKEQRDAYPIVTDDNGNIIWIPGVKKSKFDRKKDKKYDIILKYD
ncbi:MAG: tRNA lysidine(34) synthetase TilS [bacterium]|nr:tRNA lysidine(34) synthetase TilS [bacterium]